MDRQPVKVEVPADKFEGPTLRQKVSRATTMNDLFTDFAFFTPAPFFVYGKLDRDPVQEWVNESDGDPVVSVLSLPQPLFAGLSFNGDMAWNHRIMLVERPRWDSLLSFLSGVMIKDTPRKILYEAFPHAVFAPDRLAQDRGQVGTPVPVTVFGLSGNRRKIVAESGVGPVASVVVRAVLPDSLVVERAKKMFR